MTRIPPQNKEAEQAILGTMFLNADSVPVVLAEINVDDFYTESHRLIFSACVSEYEKGNNVDVITVSESLHNSGCLETSGGASYLATLTSIIPISSKVESYCRIVKDKAKGRKLIGIANEMLEGCYDGSAIDSVVDIAGEAFFKTVGDSKAQFIGSLLVDAIDEAKERCNSDDSFVGLSTGLVDLDNLLGGLQKPDLVILAGRPSMGKTTLALNIAGHAAENGAKTALFSLEMSGKQLARKTLAESSRVSLKAIQRGFLGDHHWPKLVHAVDKMKDAPLLIDDTPALTITQLRSKAKIIALRYGLDLIVVDYLQLMRARAESREREVSKISAGLKALAKELDIPILCLSQLSRKCEERTDKRPLLSDLRDSGSIEQDADIVAFIYRDEYYNREDSNPLKGISEVIISKSRNGETGVVNLYFDGKLSRFESIARENQ